MDDARLFRVLDGRPRLQAWRVLMMTALGCGVVLIPLAFALAGLTGTRIVLIACATCLVTGILGVGIQRPFHQPEAPLLMAVVGFLVRMSLPLALCGATLWLVGEDRARALAICFLLIYPIFLAVDTYLVLRTFKVESGLPSR